MLLAPRPRVAVTVESASCRLHVVYTCNFYGDIARRRQRESPVKSTPPDRRRTHAMLAMRGSSSVLADENQSQYNMIGIYGLERRDTALERLLR